MTECINTAVEHLSEEGLTVSALGLGCMGCSSTRRGQQLSNQFRDFQSGWPPQVFIEVRGDFCRVRVHFDGADSMAGRCLAKSGRRNGLPGIFSPDAGESY